MNNTLTNLISSERQGALRRDYFIRYCVVIVICITILIFVAAILLLPTYVFLSKSLSAKENHLANIESKISSADEAILSARITNLSRSVVILMRQVKTSSTSDVVRDLLAIPRPGIAISGFTYAPAVGKIPGIVTVSGTAVTRDSLRGYQISLQNTQFIRTVDLPISVYAKDSDISFTVTITLVP